MFYVIFFKLYYQYFRGETEENNRCGELFLDHENAGCEEILIAARKIMVDKKVKYVLKYLAKCLNCSHIFLEANNLFLTLFRE